MTILHTAAGEEVWDISSEEYSYSGSEGQELIWISSACVNV
jgi:hypothetical protein